MLLKEKFSLVVFVLVHLNVPSEMAWFSNQAWNDQTEYIIFDSVNISHFHLISISIANINAKFLQILYTEEFLTEYFRL